MMTDADGLGICAVAKVTSMGDWRALFCEFLYQLAHIRLTILLFHAGESPKKDSVYFLKNPQLGKLT